MEFTPDKQESPLSDETVCEKSEQGQKELLVKREVVTLSEPGKQSQEKPTEISQETVLAVAMNTVFAISENLPAKPGPSEIEVNSASAAVVNGTATFEGENVPHEQSPSVVLEKQSDLKLEINRLQQEIARLETVNLQKDDEIFALEKENCQLKTDCSNKCSSVIASFSFKQQEMENKLKRVKNHCKQVETNSEKVNNLLQSAAAAHSDLLNGCSEMTDKYNRYKAYCMFISERLSKVAKNDEELESEMESFEGLINEVL